MDQKIVDLYDAYTHTQMGRRAFMERLVALTGSLAAAEAALALLAPNYAMAAIVAENDPRLLIASPTDSASGLKGYSAVLKDQKPEAGNSLVIVVHENRGLNPHIQDVARRLAIAGFPALAVDMLTPVGGTPADEDKARDLFPKLDLGKGIASLVQLISGHKAHNPTLKLAALGFCWGGSMVNALATAASDLDAAVVFYGASPRLEDVPRIKAKMQMHYAGLDARINEGVPAYEDALKKARVKYEMFTYEKVNHAFHNDTGKERYAEASARLAWSRTLDFLRASIR